MAKAAPSAPRHLRDFRTETLRGQPGFVRVGQTPSGQWWLIDARDRPFFSRGVAAVNRHGRAGPRPSQPGEYERAVAQLHGVEDPRVFVLAALDRLRAWRCNTLGPWSAPEFFERGFFFTETVGFRHAAPECAIKLGGALLPDVFDPRWVEACDPLAAAACGARRGSGELLGYFTDDGLQWAQPRDATDFPRPERPTLLQICLSLEPSFPAYHAAWEFVLAPHGGDLGGLASSWETEPNKEALRQRTLADRPLASGGYLRDHERFTREFARRYFAVCAAAIRRHDPNHLVLGCRFEAVPAAAVLAECAAPAVDVVAIAVGCPAVGEALEAGSGAGAMPVLIADFSWIGESFTQPEKTAAARPTTAVERMLAHGREALTRACGHPAAVGYFWSRWADEPDDLPPFGRGLVHVDDREAREHTELFTELNTRAETLRRCAGATHPTSPAR